jgi:hypothetical protein
VARRYVGEAFVNIDYRPRKGDYAGYVRVGRLVWNFDELIPPKELPYGAGPESPSAFDAVAKAAISFGSYYTNLNRRQVPRWAPPVEVADAIYQAVESVIDPRGRYAVRRSRDGVVRWK